MSLPVFGLIKSNPLYWSNWSNALKPDWIIAELQNKPRSLWEYGIVATLGLDSIVDKSDSTVSPDQRRN